MHRDRRSVAVVLRELRLPRPERHAARAERAAEAQIRRERDNEHSAARRAAALEAEARRYRNVFGSRR
jgi:hypothetical protein